VNALLLIDASCQFIGKELPSIPFTDASQVTKVLWASMYAEGFLTKDHFQVFMKDSKKLSDIPDVVGIATDNLKQSFSPSLDDWTKVEPKMQNFIDNTVKSSILNAAA